VVELFFHLASKWPKWCAQTLHPFPQILIIFSRVGAPVVTPSSDDFSNLFSHWKGLSSPENAVNVVKIGLEKPTLRLVEVIHYVTDTIEKRQRAWQTRNKSNATFEAVQYRQDVRRIAHYHKRKHFSSYTRCSENHNNTCAENQKIRGLKYDTLY